MSKCPTNTSRKLKKSKDSFLNDLVLHCTEQETAYDNDPPFCDLDLLADDDSLSQYLNGEAEEMTEFPSSVSTRSVSSDQRTGNHQEHFVSSDEDTRSIGSGKQIIVVARPSHYNKGNSNSRQAVAARENRQKKKQYLSGLQKSVEALSKENTDLKVENADQKLQLGKLKAEVAYLKNVIANQSTLTGLLKNIQNTNGIRLAASLGSSEDDASSLKSAVGQKRKRVVTDSTTGRKRNCSGRSSVSACSSTADEIDTDATESVGTSACGSPLRYSSIQNPEQCQSSAVQTDEIESADEPDMSTGGVCLHVLGNSVSIEFCSVCNHNAAKSCSVDHAYFRSNSK